MNTELVNKRVRWQKLWCDLHTIRLAPLPTETDVDMALAGLPPRRENEALGNWLKRALSPDNKGLPFSQFRFSKIGEVYLQAAASGDEFPLPEQPLETADQSFRLTLSEHEGYLSVKIEALGLAIDEFRGQYIGIAANNHADTVIAITQLDQDGESTIVLKDTQYLRKILCVHPVLGLIEPNYG